MKPVKLQPSNLTYSLARFSPTAGFPNPCEDYIQSSITLDSIMIDNPTSTFLFKVKGESMQPLIADGSIIIVDKSLPVASGKIVLATIDGSFVVKRLIVDAKSGVAIFRSENDAHEDIRIPIDEDNNWESATVWGVVTGELRKF